MMSAREWLLTGLCGLMLGLALASAVRPVYGFMALGLAGFIVIVAYRSDERRLR